MARLLITSILAFLLHYNLYGQENTPVNFFYEIIRNDSIVMFFNKYGQFTDKKCAEYRRYVRLNSNGNFNSPFIDIDVTTGKIIAKGRYIDSKLDGTFEWFYPDGIKKLVGVYSLGMPTGEWTYFHENTQPERTLDISNDEILLKEFKDQKGNILVQNGKGTFEGAIDFLSDNGGVIAKGEVENGRANNVWTATFLDEPYATERFKNGQLKYGKNGSNIKDQNDKPDLNNFIILPRYIAALERFKTAHCFTPATPTWRIYARYAYIVDRFNQDDHDTKLALELMNAIHTAEWKTKVRDNDTYYLTIKLYLNKDGKAEKTELVSEFGQAYFNAFSNLFKERLAFPDAPEVIYFHMRIYLAYHIRKQSLHIFSLNQENPLRIPLPESGH